ncbi:SDR family NAD(P)-dependent oxidoreductase [Granulicella tundricola]|uniref:Short-chain dehydrogenase/reductase SDR n=1 Tax=Granulicella tundricola (strain ATCC BAA-1859 / DSM 23138 / MP5ACTX9) TaxID=1198114 RepID=E8WVD6_GRATM|nr:SDR family NAD(P)-dependent oxidoreductase [Granulicella tundricola]ADW68384.1 short-chain dehydrogenase/reductase SDR [Granulicella tundricola MP5ACTX9]
MPKIKSNTESKAYVLTGPTSGSGRATALNMVKLGILVLVGRNAAKLAKTKKEIEHLGGRAVSVVCDFSDLASVHRAGADIVSLNLSIVGLLNNAGIQNPDVTKTGDGWDNTFVTNHLGPFLLTEVLLPHLEDGANVLFVGSATEDPERKLAVRAGFRGGRYLSAEESLHGKWGPGGSTKPGMDAYATSKQCNIVTAMAFARENPRLRINAVEPGIMLATGLHDHMNVPRKILTSVLVLLLVPFVKVLSTPKRAARVFTRILTDSSGPSGVYYDEGGHPMQGSTLVRDRTFQDRVVAETRALLTKLPT